MSEVNTAGLLEILTPTWYVEAETARAVRQGIQSVLEWATDVRNDDPRDRMPLCRCAIENLDTTGALADGCVQVFPMRGGRPVAPSTLPKMLRHLAIAAEETDLPRDVIEAALAHTVQSKVEAAYARSDLFERQWRLMEDWLGYLASKAGDAPGDNTNDPVARCITS
ncbi:MAG: hypothetical protein OXN97_00570 [Bryobacterales bacterium]|nr:hypothetical protein [Bryobacterales bacterium]